LLIGSLGRPVEWAYREGYRERLVEGRREVPLEGSIERVVEGA
jgi:hypothetical protein